MDIDGNKKKVFIYMRLYTQIRSHPFKFQLDVTFSNATTTKCQRKFTMEKRNDIMVISNAKCRSVEIIWKGHIHIWTQISHLFHYAKGVWDLFLVRMTVALSFNWKYDRRMTIFRLNLARWEIVYRRSEARSTDKDGIVLEKSALLIFRILYSDFYCSKETSSFAFYK